MKIAVPWRQVMAGLLFGLALGLVLFLGFPGSNLDSASAERTNPANGARPVEQAPAPDFALEQLDGGPLSLSEHRGQIVLVNFWATWCAPCRLEMPALQDRFERYRNQGFVVLAVNDEEPAGDVREYVEELGLTFPVLLDPSGQVQQLYAVHGYPSSYLIDRAGTIHLVQIGILSEDQLDRSLRELGLTS
jgi:cytochrome c biogenesis protein CcmG/thiol:disulfide interchange protein DsbE